MFKGITRNWTFWGAFILFSLGCGIVGGNYLFKALPLLSIDLKMTRQEALAKAAAVAQSNQWQPLDYGQVASFESDQMAQFFAELDCGGIDTFKKMIEEKLYAPYKWHVRHFKENVTHETHLYFTPEGTSYGFEIKLPDTELSENFTVSQARDLALQTAQKEWNVSFEQFTEIEASKDTKPNGRVDHCFVYEHTTKTLGAEGKYRIKLIVRGNQFCTLSQYVQIPESFTRKYQEMRSANTLLHTTFSTIFKILYIVLGGLVGGFFLIRTRRYLLKPLVIALACITTLSILDGINKLPLMWMYYATSTAQSTFASTYVLQIIFGALINFIVFFLAIGAAEGFDRIAFPGHFQFWRLWSKKIGGSLNILGQTITGYCLFGINLLLMTITYYLLTTWFGWWAPASTLMDPNILATQAPWLSAFVPSLSAGFWEEFATRALPLAGAVIIGNYFGRKNLFLIIGFIGQAIIFGGMHAFYAQQPAYFRIVELIAPSFIWAGVYIAFGLLPGIICHYLWDLMWFALPLMVCQAPEMFLQKWIIILLGLAPLLIVLFRRAQVGSWNYANDSERNAAWQPTPEADNQDTVELPKMSTALSGKTKKIILGLGLLGAGATFFFGNKTNTNSSLSISHEQAIRIAQDTFKTVPHSEKDWRILANARTGIERGAKAPSLDFIWRTQKEMYPQLLGSYLPDTQWAVRFASFEGEVAARAEEYTVYLDSKNGTVERIQQTVPENAPGATLSQAEARGIALAAVEHYFGLQPDQLKEISATDLKRPERKDWQFIFQDTTKELQADGQARITITIAGNKVIDYERSVFVPETWTRTENERTAAFNVFGMVNILLLLALSVMALTSFGNIILSNFCSKRTLSAAICLFLLSMATALLRLSFLYFGFSTAQPFSSQYTTLLVTLFGSIVMASFFVAPLLAHLHLLTRYQQIHNGTVTVLLAGVSIVGIISGLNAVIAAYLPSLSPHIADLIYFNSSYPLITITLSGITTFLRFTVVAVLFSWWITLITNGWTRKQFFGACCTILTGIIFISIFFADAIWSGLLLGTITGLCLLVAHYFILQHDLRIALAASGSFMALMLLQEACVNGFAGSWYAHGFAAFCVCLATMVMVKKFEQNN